MKDPEENSIEKKRKGPNLIAAFFVITSIGVAAYIGWQSFSLEREKTELKLAIETQKQNLVELKQREQIGEKMRAAEILRKAQNFRTKWSVIYQDLNEAFLAQSAIKFKSVNVSNDNQVQVRAEARDFLTAAGFLVLAKRAENFDNAFISAISPSGESEGEGVVYNFTATFNYSPETQEN